MARDLPLRDTGRGPPPAPVGDRAWLLFASIGVALLLAYRWLPLPAQNVAYDTLDGAAVVALLVAAHRCRGTVATAWALLAAARLSSTVGDVLYDVIAARAGDVPVPSAADVFYLAVYPLTAGALFLLARASTVRHRGDAATDALIAGTAAALILWVLMRPAILVADIGLAEQTVTLAYPVGDLVLLILTLRLVLGPRRRCRSLALLVLGTILMTFADLIFAVVTARTGVFLVGGWADLLWMASFVAFGAAALHPSMPQVGAPGPEPLPLSRRRVILLVIAGLVPTIVVTAAIVRGQPVDVVPFVVSASALFLLALARVVGVARGQGRTIRRERSLREASSALVAAWSTAEVWQVAIDRASEIVGNRFTVERAGDDAGATASDGTLGLPVGQDDQHGGLLVHGPIDQLSTAGRESLRSLAAMAGLALEAIEKNHAVRRGEQRFQSIVYTASDLMFVLHPDTTIIWCGESVEVISGYRAQDVVGRRLTTFLHPDDTQVLDYFGAALTQPGSSARAEARLRMSDGAYRTFDIHARNLLTDPSVAGLVLTGSDVTELRERENELRELAYHDPLTGLANRSLLLSRLQQCLRHQPSEGQNAAVIFINLDDFKTVNDSLGRETGDELLRQVSERIIEIIRDVDTAARFGGDEFAILLTDATRTEAFLVARRIQDALAAPFMMNHPGVFVRVSIGVALADGTASAENMLRNADIAMHQAKSAGKNRIETFESRMHSNALRRLQLYGDMRRALDRDEFVLYYQPIVNMRSGSLTGYEALVRWQHPSNRLFSPAEFIPVAEETGLIVPLGRWILREACAQAARWQRQHLPSLTMSVNLSARQLADEHIIDDVVDALGSAGLDPGALTLELTESALVADVAATTERLHMMNAIGVRIAIDDFGTGYSSLSYIKQFPVHELKIDQSFVSGSIEPGDSLTLVNLIIELAQSLHLTTVAEGIETVPQLEWLLGLGCDHGQGYLFSRPRDAATTERALAAGEFRPRAA